MSSRKLTDLSKCLNPFWIFQVYPVPIYVIIMWKSPDYFLTAIDIIAALLALLASYIVLGSVFRPTHRLNQIKRLMVKSKAFHFISQPKNGWGLAFGAAALTNMLALPIIVSLLNFQVITAESGHFLYAAIASLPTFFILGYFLLRNAASSILETGIQIDNEKVKFLLERVSWGLLVHAFFLIIVSKFYPLLASAPVAISS